MACPTCDGTGRILTPETIVRRAERAVKRMAVDGRKDAVMLKLHPAVALHVLEQEKDLVKRLERAAGAPIELRDDPLLRQDEYKLLIKSAGRDITEQYAVA
jgi:ribonuclease G